MASFYDVFKGNIVLTGERGDSIWDRNAVNVNNTFALIPEMQVWEVRREDYG